MQLEILLTRHTSVRFFTSARRSLCVAAGFLFGGCAFAAPPAASTKEMSAALRNLPMRFEQDATGHWTARGAGYALAFEDSAVDFHVPDGVARLLFEGSKAGAKWEPSEKALAPTNYFRGSTFRSADAFGRLRRSSLYPGIDVVYYGNGGELEYDFMLAPGADASRIRMRLTGTGEAAIDDAGSLALKLGSGKIVQRIPVAYQTGPLGEKIAVQARYRAAADGSVGIELGAYDRARALVIDPSILYDFWFTGSNAQVAIALGHDGQGFEYMAGYTYSPDFTAGGVNGYNPNYSSDEDCWLVKFNPFPTNPSAAIVYSTYFGGSLDDDMRSMAVDQNGVMYFGGTSLSPDLPVSANAYQNTLPNTNANVNGFVAAIDSNQPGSAGLIYSSFYGGSDTVIINGIAEFGGQIYATGWTATPDLPTVNAFQSTEAGSYDSFVAVFDPTQTSASSSLVFSSYLGGYGEDVGRSISVDSSGLIYVTGYTFSTNYPVTTNAFQPVYNDGGGDGFVTVVDASAGAIRYSTYLGGTGIDVPTKIQALASGNVAIAGYTFSTDFPLSPNAAQPIYGGNGDAFIAVINPSAANQAEALVYGSYYGGSDVEVAYDFRADANGLFYIAGYTLSKDLPVTPGAIHPASAGGGVDAFEAIIDPNTAVTYGSYITGPGNQVAYAVDYDASGNIFAAGYATSDIFPNNTPPHGVTGVYDVFLLLVSPH